jgi:hypothetical protein
VLFWVLQLPLGPHHHGLGPVPLRGGGVFFRVWAPNALEVSVTLWSSAHVNTVLDRDRDGCGLVVAHSVHHAWDAPLPPAPCNDGRRLLVSQEKHSESVDRSGLTRLTTPYLPRVLLV